MGYNHQTGFNNGGLCLQTSLSVFLVWVLFAVGFVSFLVSGYIWNWLCLFVSWGLSLILGLCVLGLVSM